MSQKKPTETIRPAAAAVLLLSLSILALGCSKKAEECAAVQRIAAAVRPQLDIDVKDDSVCLAASHRVGPFFAREAKSSFH